MNTRSHCVQRTNIQNLKAIHNDFTPVYRKYILCSKNEYTKSESNSQLTIVRILKRCNCVQRTNIQNLKAIHNIADTSIGQLMIVFKERIYKI